MPFERSPLASIVLLSALLSAPALAAGCAKGSQGLTGGGGAGADGAGGAGASGASPSSGGTTTTADTGGTPTTTTSSSGDTTTSTTTTSGTTSSTSSTTTSSGTTTSTSTTTTVGGDGCPLNHVVMSELRTRGVAGGSDEFIELYNAAPSEVTLDSTWKLEGRKAGGASYSTRWTGASQTVPAWGHFLIVGQAYAQSPAGDATFSSGISDATSVRLVHGAVTVDAVCYYFDAASQTAYDATYTCEGSPVSNLPHDDSVSAASNADASLQRLPSGGSPSCQDTDDNASDFALASPAEPQNTASPPTP